jgi:uncharacterized SAM-binding protein YcdF (DUF218 family)
MVNTIFILKNVISFFILPLSIVSALMVSGLILLWATKRQFLGKIFVTLGTGLLLFASFGFLADHLIVSLENRYLPLLDVKNIQRTNDIKWIVILGGGNIPDPRLPISNQVAPASLTRLLEGVNLYRQLPGSRLILSGGSVFRTPEAETLAKIARLMGIREEDIVCENKSLDTADQAKMISNIVGRSQFILVTSAIHMPRSMALFRKYGMDPIPAPTSYMVHKQSQFNPGVFFPSTGSLGKMEIAIHEYLGIIWMRVQ